MTFRFGVTSNKRLNTCHEDLQTIFRAAIADPNCPFDFFIACGERNELDQQAAFDAGNSKAKFGESPHNFNPSLAVDAVPCETKWASKKNFEILADHICMTTLRLFDDGMIKNKIFWGGDFKSFYDGPHFQLMNWKDLKGE
jgi:hypothetical protein